MYCSDYVSLRPHTLTALSKFIEEMNQSETLARTKFMESCENLLVGLEIDLLSTEIKCEHFQLIKKEMSECEFFFS